MIKKIKSLGKWSFVPGIVLGAIAGFLYYYFIGCTSGSCAITSNPLNSTLYFAGLGGLMFNALFSDDKKKSTSINN